MIPSDCAEERCGMIGYAEADGQPVQRTEAFIHLAQQLATPPSDVIRPPSNRPITSRRPREGVKFKLFGITLRLHRPLSWWLHKVLFALVLCTRIGAFFYPHGERYGPGFAGKA